MNIIGLGGVKSRKKLTKTQKELLKTVSNYIGTNNPMPYDLLKKLSEFKSFDSSFNVLVNNGYVIRHITDDYSNQFKLNKL